MNARGIRLAKDELPRLVHSLSEADFGARCSDGATKQPINETERSPAPGLLQLGNYSNPSQTTAPKTEEAGPGARSPVQLVRP